MPGTLNSLIFYSQVNILSIPGILGRFFGGVRARGEFLMLIRKFLSYLDKIFSQFVIIVTCCSYTILVPPGVVPNMVPPGVVE